METVNTVSLGIPVNVLENRTAAICIRNEVPYLVMAAKGLVLSVNLDNHHVNQLDFPDQVKGEYPYDSCSDGSGLFYTAAGKTILVYDPEENNWFDMQKHPLPSEEIAGISMTASPKNVYFSSYPGTYLSQYDPQDKKLFILDQLDESEMYTGSMAVDNDGWIYAGIGTQRKDLVAYHPEKSGKYTFIKDDERTTGYGLIFQTIDGKVYGSDDANHEEANWFSLSDGKCTRIEQPKKLKLSTQGSGFHRIKNAHLLDKKVTYSLPSKQFTINDQTYSLDYESTGADLSPVTKYNGHVIGTSNHPLRLFSFKEKFMVYPEQTIKYGGGGNICTFTQWGDALYGAAYAGGHIHKLLPQPDGRLAVDYLASVPQIYRPRASAILNDQSCIVFGGFGAYGTVGGGLAILDPITEKIDVWENHDLVQGQSVIALSPYEKDYVVAGTSVETPGGAKPITNTAAILLLDIKSKKILDRMPLKGIREIVQLSICEQGFLHIVTSCSLYIVWDLKNKKEMYRENLQQYGHVVREGMIKRKENRFVLVFSKAILEVADTNINLLYPLKQEATMGGTIINKHLYYASGTALHRLPLEKDLSCIV